MRRLPGLGAVVGCLAAMLAACGSSGLPQKLTVRSSAFAPGGPIPSRYTCDGQDVSPPLTWSGVPNDATQLTLTMNDPDAPGGSFIHWQMSGLSPRSPGLAAGSQPAVGNAGTNSFGTTGYRGPCPPRGAAMHRYVITITALANGGAVAFGTLTGTYARR